MVRNVQGRTTVGGFLLSLLLLFAQGSLRAEQLNVQLVLHWEGRALEEPNLDALEALRRTYPEVPIVHLLNPVYFLPGTLSQALGERLRALIRPTDEVGLYLSADQRLLDLAQVPVRLQPTFWAYIDDRETCGDLCGLDVPLTSFRREDVLAVFTVADRVLREQGFQEPRSFAVRGWVTAPFVGAIAEAFAYRFDLTGVDPRLVTPTFREYPLAAWLQDRSRGAVAYPWSQAPATNVEALDVNGGIVEFNQQTDVIQRLDAVLPTVSAGKQASFRLSLSQESAFQGLPRLRVLLRAIEAQARQKGTRLVYTTPSQLKNDRPVPENMRISGLLPR